MIDGTGLWYLVMSARENQSPSAQAIDHVHEVLAEKAQGSAERREGAQLLLRTGNHILEGADVPEVPKVHSQAEES